jgi:hypothetical protein
MIMRSISFPRVYHHWMIVKTSTAGYPGLLVNFATFLVSLHLVLISSG